MISLLCLLCLKKEVYLSCLHKEVTYRCTLSIKIESVWRQSKSLVIICIFKIGRILKNYVIYIFYYHWSRCYIYSIVWKLFILYLSNMQLKYIENAWFFYTIIFSMKITTNSLDSQKIVSRLRFREASPYLTPYRSTLDTYFPNPDQSMFIFYQTCI